MEKRTLLSTFDKQAASFGISKIQRIEGSNLFVSYGLSLKTIYVWDYRNPQNYRYSIDSAIHLDRAAAFIYGTGLLCARAIEWTVGGSNYSQYYFCKQICKNDTLYNFAWAQCSSEKHCIGEIDKNQKKLGYCSQCKMNQYYSVDKCVDCSQNCHLKECNQTNGVCIIPGCINIQECGEEEFFNNATCMCQTCISPCSNCKDQVPFQVCTACEEDIQFNPPSCKSSCPPGKTYINNVYCIEACKKGNYYNYKIGQCSQCDFGCESCVDFLCNENCTFYQFKDQNEDCQDCALRCTKCNNSENCTECKLTSTQNIIRVQKNNCACPNAYFDIGFDCIACPRKCYTCSDIETCITCQQTSNPTKIQRDILKNCTCPDNYQDIGSDCITCPAKCQICNSDSKCQTCAVTSQPSKVERIIDDNCACPAGYFDTGSDCQACEISHCIDCTLSKKQCISCKGNHRSVDKNCECSTGYKDADEGNDCIKDCGNYCQTCEDNGCSECTDSNRNLTNNCKCKSEYYQNEEECVSCSINGCSTCENDVCTLCKGNSNIRLPENKCQCSKGYWEQDDQCVKCLDQCETCTGGESCQTCVGIKGESKTRNKDKNCSCPDGYYSMLPEVYDCFHLECDFKCMTCNIENKCLTCSNEKRNLTNGCQCKEGYYDVENQVVCGVCSPSCKQCTNSNVCLVCKGDKGKNYSRIFNQQCSCPEGFYDDGSDNCKNCNIQCKTCSKAANNCTECIGTKNQPFSRQIENQCQCPDEYSSQLPKLEDCQREKICLPICKTCSNAFSCDSCADDNGLRILQKNCQCPVGYYDMITTKIKNCQKCPEQCSSCEKENVCQVCDGPQNQLSSRVLPECNCPAGYYEDTTTKKCTKCNFKCGSCNNQNQCTTCVESIRDPTTCECPSGYYDKNGVCQECLPNCATCGADLTCLTCLTDENGVKRNKPTCDCPSGYFSESSQSTSCIKITKCNNPQCTCTNADGCDKCVGNNRYMRDGCKCNEGFYSQWPLSNDCGKCAKNCETCKFKSFKCLICKGKNRVGTDCECKKGYEYKDNDNNDCTQKKSECSIVSCDICDSTDSNKCLICKNKQLSLPSCSCPIDYYQDSDYNCLQCLEICKTCSHAASCETCKDENALLGDGTCNICNKGYEKGENGVCQKIKCNPGCELCTITGECFECNNFERILPSCSCPKGKSDDLPNSSACLICDKNCQSCSLTNSNCVTCQTVNRQPPNCTECKEGFKPDLADIDGDDCIEDIPILFPYVDEGANDGEESNVPYPAQIVIGVTTVYATTFTMIPVSKGASTAFFQASNFIRNMLAVA